MFKSLHCQSSMFYCLICQSSIFDIYIHIQIYTVYMCLNVYIYIHTNYTHIYLCIYICTYASQSKSTLSVKICLTFPNKHSVDLKPRKEQMKAGWSLQSSVLLTCRR